MPEDSPVGVALCSAHRAAFSAQLEGIASDVMETKEGVSDLLRIIAKGNGREPLTSEVAKNTEFRGRYQTRRLAGLHLTTMWWVAVITWLLTAGLAAWGFAT
jgi:hypothetical protein